MPSFTNLDDLVRLVDDRRDIYVRWSRGPDPDLRSASSTTDTKRRAAVDCGICRPIRHSPPALPFFPTSKPRSPTRWAFRRRRGRRRSGRSGFPSMDAFSASAVMSPQVRAPVPGAPQRTTGARP
ncbi:DUF6098 family protein [Streptomyces bikiniensis]|uniref:DUF6098 family protein n=1 Tax=Streptomyces bikiniensis TaxID=1896 RepID=A0ABW8CUS5_STRBI